MGSGRNNELRIATDCLGTCCREQSHAWFNPLLIAVIPNYAQIPNCNEAITEDPVANPSDPNPAGSRFEKTKTVPEPGPMKRKQLVAAMATLRDLRAIHFSYVLDEADLKLLSTLHNWSDWNSERTE